MLQTHIGLFYLFVFTARNHKFGRQNQGGPSESDDETEYNNYGTVKTLSIFSSGEIKIPLNIHKC